jgi:hypothetical protein
MLGAQGHWAERGLYRATPAVTRDLDFSGLIRRTAPFNMFSRLLRHTRGCGESNQAPHRSDKYRRLETSGVGSVPRMRKDHLSTCQSNVDLIVLSGKRSILQSNLCVNNGVTGKTSCDPISVVFVNSIIITILLFAYFWLEKRDCLSSCKINLH